MDSLPLAGKYTVKPLTESLFNCRTGEEARAKFILVNMLLGTFDCLHGVQALLGGTELVKDAARLSKDPTLLRMAETAMDGAYVLINLGVITANTILLCRLWHRALSQGFVSKNLSGERRCLGSQDSPKVIVATLLLTFAGQIGYLSTTSYCGDHKEENNKPKPSAVKPST
jgi:hypothetical protein